MSLWEQYGELLVYKSFISIYPDYAPLYHQIAGCIPPLIEVEVSCEPDNISENFTDASLELNVGDETMGDFAAPEEKHCSCGISGTAPQEGRGKISSGKDLQTQYVESMNRSLEIKDPVGSETNDHITEELVSTEKCSNLDKPLASQGLNGKSLSDEKEGNIHSYAQSNTSEASKSDHCYTSASNIDHHYSATEQRDEECNKDISNNSSHYDAVEITGYSQGITFSFFFIYI